MVGILRHWWPIPGGKRMWIDFHIAPLRDRRAEIARGESEMKKAAEEERRSHIWFLESMDRINRTILGTHDIEQMMSDVLNAVLTMFECDRAWLLCPSDPKAVSFAVLMERTRPEYPGALALGEHLAASPDFAATYQSLLAAGAPVQFGGLGSLHPMPAVAAERFSVQSAIAMAIYPKGDKPYAFGLHQCSYARDWTPNEQRLFEEIGRRLADALTKLLALRSLHDSEERLRLALAAANAGAWMWDISADRDLWSPEHFELCGLDPAGGVPPIPEWFERCVHPEDRQRVACELEAALKSGTFDAASEYRIIHPRTGVRWILCRCHIEREDG